MNKLQALFVVSTSPANFQFDDAEQAAKFARAIARVSAKTYRRMIGQNSVAGTYPRVGSNLNAFPLDAEGNPTEHGMTLSSLSCEVELSAKDDKPKGDSEKPTRTPRGGRKAKDQIEDEDDDSEDETD